MAMTKAGLAQELCDQLGVNKREAKELVELYFDTIRATLSEGRLRQLQYQRKNSQARA